MLFAGLLASLPVMVMAESESATLNKDLQIRFLLPGKAPAEEEIKQRLLAGHNIQALIIDREGGTAGGRLIDPRSVQVSWGDDVIEDAYVLYKSPNVAIVFASIGATEFPIGKPVDLSLTAKFFDSTELDAGWRIPLSFSSDEKTTATLARRHGPAIRINDADGKTVADASYFGQRREDLFAMADGQGTVVLDSMTRNTPGAHYAMAPGYWTTEFDPMTSRTITLAKREVVARGNVKLVDEAGESIAEALILVASTDYVRWKSSAPQPLEMPAQECGALAVVAGYLPENFRLQADETVTVKLRKRIAEPKAK